MTSSLDARPTIRIYLCSMTQSLTIKGKARPEFHYDKADDCVNFYIGFSL